MSAPSSKFESWYERHGKRLVDILFAGLGLLVLSPIMLAISLLILATDLGPVIFRQERVGRYGNLFILYKFRSMPVGTRNAAKDQLGQLHITRFGRLLRRTNLDELPQLFNILKGDMSVVGPRPPIPSQVELITIRRLNGALTCRPGLTGLAQVNAYDGMTLSEKARYDGAYAARVSLILDSAIVVRTLGYMTRPPPVY